jgi:hypothetical protein
MIKIEFYKDWYFFETSLIDHMPISDEFEEDAAPILYELVEKRGTNFQPWTGKRNYEPWRGKRSSGHTDQGN